MRKILIAGLVVLNGLLAVAVFATPAETQFASSKQVDCCRGVGSEAYCCRECCWFNNNCSSKQDCRSN